MYEEKTIAEKIKKYKCFRNLKLSQEQAEELAKIWIHYHKLNNLTRFQNLKQTLFLNFVSYNVPFPWLEKTLLSEKIGHGCSLGHFKSRYGDEIGKKLYHEFLQKCKFDKEKYIEKHGVAKYEVVKKKKIVNNIDILIERHGEEEGNKRFQTYLKNWKKSIKELGGWDNGLSLEKLVEKHGKKEGYKRWNKKRNKQKRRFSVDWYKKKYGDAWETEWNRYCERMASLSLLAQEKNANMHSAVSQKLFWKIYHLLDDSQKEFCRFAELNKEECFTFPKELRESCDSNIHWFLVDFKLKNKIIEFDGKYWHSQDEIKQRDKDKTEYLQSCGFSVFRIPEQDYIDDRIQVLNKCLEFLND